MKQQRKTHAELEALGYRLLKYNNEVSERTYINRNGDIYTTGIRERHLKQYIGNSGYYITSVLMTKDIRITIYVHRAVAFTFIPNYEITKNMVNHKNLNRLDNTVENLEWCTGHYNMQHYMNMSSPENMNCRKRICTYVIGHYNIVMYKGHYLGTHKTPEEASYKVYRFILDNNFVIPSNLRCHHHPLIPKDLWI